MKVDLGGSLPCLPDLPSSLSGHFDDGDLGFAALRVEFAQQRGRGTVVDVVRREARHEPALFQAAHFLLVEVLQALLLEGSHSVSLQ